MVMEAPRDEEAAPAPRMTVRERLRLFWRLAVPYFREAEGAKLNFGLLLALVLVDAAISVIFSFVSRDFYSALSAKDQALFLAKTANFAVGLAVATPLAVLFKFQRQRLAYLRAVAPTVALQRGVEPVLPWSPRFGRSW
jgi:ABC-type uncharacterized transport system fused permease/ATPase subunit